MLEKKITDSISEAFNKLFSVTIPDKISLQKTRKDVKGDYTFNVFPFLRLSKQSPEETANKIGQFLKENLTEIADFEVIKGFLNIIVNNDIWLHFLQDEYKTENRGLKKLEDNTKVTMVEYSSPNTNKPLHLGHIRNNLLGYAVAELLKANGKKVVKTNIVNDRGIHICKSMLAWQKWGQGATPESSQIKGDKGKVNRGSKYLERGKIN